MPSKLTLQSLGWNSFFRKAFAPYAAKGWQPARLIRDNKISYGALMAGGAEVEAVMSGKVYHEAETDAELPAVGDWVALELPEEEGVEAMIRARLPRKTCLSRKMPGKSTEEQVIAANVDLVVVVTDPGPDLNLRRMERYFAIIGRSRAKALVLVNKRDLFPAEQCHAAVEAIRSLHPEAEVFSGSATDGSSAAALRSYLGEGVSMTLIGSSGVGKSSVINQLLGDEYQWTDEVNAVTGKGRHSTTARELFVLRGEGILIDNPGIREVQMWTDEATLRERFADLDDLATQCKFHDCKHGSDAGCAIRAAMAAGQVSQGRFENYLKLEEEIAALRRNRVKREMTVGRWARREEEKKAKQFAKRRREDPDEDFIPRRR